MTAIWKSAALFSPLFALWFLNERITSYQAMLILLGFIGIMTVAKPSAGIVSIAGAAALGSAVLLALIAVSIRKLHETEHAFTIVQAFCLYGTLLGCLLFFPYFKWPSLNEWILVVLMGTIGTIGQTTFTMAFKFEETAIIQPYSFFEIVFAVLIGWFYWGQAPALHAIIGMALIVSSGALLLRSNRRG
jgi:drug/metabolite transporter (DMT)-like permease